MFELTDRVAIIGGGIAVSPQYPQHLMAFTYIES